MYGYEEEQAGEAEMAAQAVALFTNNHGLTFLQLVQTHIKIIFTVFL
jgi:hypothetical protein